MTDDLEARKAALAARRTGAPAKRGHAATGGRLLAAGLSTGAALLLTGAMARVPHTGTPAAPAPAVAATSFLDRVATNATTAPTTLPAAPAGTPVGTARPSVTAAPAPPVVTAAPAPLPPATTSRAS